MTSDKTTNSDSQSSQKQWNQDRNKKGAQVDRNHESVPRSPPTYKREREKAKASWHEL